MPHAGGWGGSRIQTDIDLLGALASLMGWRQPGVRITVQVTDETGQLARVAGAIAEVCGLLAGGRLRGR